MFEGMKRKDLFQAAFSAIAMSGVVYVFCVAFLLV